MRAKRKQIVADKVVIGPPRLTIYEYTAIVAVRSMMIAFGAPILLNEKDLRDLKTDDPIEIAKLEIKKKVLPLTIMRYLPDGRYQLIPISWLEVEENI